MSSFIYYALIGTQFLAIAVIFIEMIYLAFLRPSRFQLEMVLLLVATFIMLVGYSVEIFANSIETAMDGAGIAYIGKPFVLLLSLIFVSDYCGHQIPRRVVLPLGGVAMMFPLIIFTNGITETQGHHLYYSTVAFDEGKMFSPLVLKRGPVYIVFGAYMILMFGSILFVIIKEIITNKSKSAKKPLIYIAGMIVCSILGYVLYLSGITQGYDTTMTGAALGALCLTIVLLRYNLIDMFTYAREHALHNVSTGLLVVNDRNQSVYTNAKINELSKEGITCDELLSLSDGNQIMERNENVYQIRKSSIEKSGVCYGKTIEIDDITAQYHYHIQLEHDVEERTKVIQNIQRSVISSFAGIVEARDNSTGVHIKRMSKYVELIAKSLMANGKHRDVLNEEYITSLVDVAPLHDIGKLSIPDAILLKPGKLNDEEFEIMKTHTLAGARIIFECLGNVERPEYVELATDVAHFHHEKWNGTGYPDHLAGEEIPLSARIVAVADVYDAIRSERCYKAPVNKPEALAVIVEGKGTHFDPEIVDAFLNILEQIEAV